mgnify:CR=1 FL=1
MLDEVPTTTAELCAARYFVNAFVWERSSEVGAREAIESWNESEEGE